MATENGTSNGYVSNGDKRLKLDEIDDETLHSGGQGYDLLIDSPKVCLESISFPQFTLLSADTLQLRFSSRTVPALPTHTMT